MHKYKVIEENEDYKLSKIEKTGGVVHFTINDIEADERNYNKLLKELTAKKALEEAKMKNIEDHHPYINDFTDEEKFTVHMYQEAKIMVDALAPKIKEIEGALATYIEEKKDIFNQIGVPINKIDLYEETQENKQ
jgi:hypothetical protein